MRLRCSSQILPLTILFGLLMYSLFSHAQTEQNDKLLLVSSISIINDMVTNIAGDHAKCQSIVPLGYDPHTYEATPEDAILAAKADMVFVNGLTLEGWLDELIDNSGGDAVKVTATAGVDAISSLVYENSYDPHAWMVASNGIIYAKNIAEALIAFDPQHEADYRANLERYVLRLQELDTYIKQEIQNIPEEHRVLVTSHDAFQYYGQRYGLALESILGTSTDAEVQTTDIIRVSKLIKTRQLPAIFVESTINPQLIEQISKENRIAIGGELYADSLGDEEGPAATYIKMLRHNTTTIVEALSKTHTNPNQHDETKKSSKSILTYALLGLSLIVIFGLVVARLNK